MERKKIRRRVIVDRELQFSLIRWFLALFIASTTIFFCITSFVFIRLEAIFHDNNVIYDLQRLQDQTSAAYGVIFFLFVIGVTAGSLFLSRKIAGPIQSLKNSLDALVEGKKIERIQFRKHDYFMDLQEKFNLFLDKYHKSK